MSYVKKAVLMTALAVMLGMVPMLSFADEKLEGKVVRAELTLCHPRPTGGGCEGILTLETKAAGSAQQVAIKVIADTIIRKGPDYLLLPATQGSLAVVTYITEKEQKIARSIDVVSAAR